ncbi:MAG: FtsX-like permease family protein [Planctomycetota bacterium]
MRLEILIARSSLLRRPARVLFSILGVAMGIATVVAIFTVDHNTLLHLQPEIATEGDFAADLVVRPTDDLDEPEKILLEQPGILEATRVARGEVKVVGPKGDAPARLLAVDLGRAERMGVLRVEEGSLRTEGRAGLLIGEKLAGLVGAAPGDTVDVVVAGARRVEVCVDGEMVERGEDALAESAVQLGVDGTLAFDRIGRSSGGAVVVVDHELAKQLFAGHLSPLELWAARDPSVDLEKLQRGLAKGFEYDLRAGAVVGQQADERAFRNGVRLSGLMTLALGLYVIFHTLSMSLTERLRDVGVLHALGASRMQIAACFFTEAVVIAIGAGLVGLFGGLALARTMLSAGITSLGMSKAVVGKFDVPWDDVGMLTLLGVGIALAGSVYPLLRAGSIDAVLALRGEPSSDQKAQRKFHVFAALLLVAVLPAVFFSVVDLVGEGSRELLEVLMMGAGVLALLFVTPLVLPGVVTFAAGLVANSVRPRFPFVGLMAARSMGNGRLRVAACVSALTLVCAAFVGLRGITRSLYLETVSWSHEALDGKVWLQNVGGVSTDRLRRVLDVPEVLGFEQGDDRVDVGFRVVGVSEDAAGYGPLAEDEELRAAFFDGRGLIVSDRLAVQQGWKKGGTVSLATPGSGLQVFRIVHVGEEYGYFRDPHERAYAVVASESLRRLYCVDTGTANSISVKLRPDADPFLAEALVRPIVPEGVNLKVTRAGEIRAMEEFDVLRDFFVFDVILLLTAALAGLGLLNAQLLATSERVKELGVLRALGASHGQIAGSVLLESFAIGVVGGLCGLGLGVAVTPAVVRALRVLSGLDLPVPAFAPAWAAIPLVAVAIALVAALYPVWRLRRASPAAAVRTG